MRTCSLRLTLSLQSTCSTSFSASIPNSALAQREIANAYYNAGKYAEAAQHYGNYVQNPNHFKQDEDRFAFLLFYGGDYQKGYDYSTALLKANPQNFTARRYQFMNAAQIKEMRDQLLPMAEALYAAHKSNKDNKFAPIDYILIASEFNDAKRPEDAQAILEEAIQDNPENPEFYKQLAMTFVNANNLSKAADTYECYLAHSEKPGYNDYIQQATFAFYAGVENKTNDPAKADKYYAMAQDYANKAAAILPDNYKPKKFEGDIAMQKAAEADVASAAVPAYTEAIAMLEASRGPQDTIPAQKLCTTTWATTILTRKMWRKQKNISTNICSLTLTTRHIENSLKVSDNKAELLIS